MKINTKQAIKDLAGKEIPSPDGIFTVGTALSNIVIDAKEGDRMKMFILAQNFYKEKEVELDDADLALVKKAVQTTTQYNNLVNGQLLQILESKK